MNANDEETRMMKKPPWVNESDLQNFEAPARKARKQNKKRLTCAQGFDATGAQ